jgi:hypothetical protein
MSSRNMERTTPPLENVTQNSSSSIHEALSKSLLSDNTSTDSMPRKLEQPTMIEHPEVKQFVVEKNIRAFTDQDIQKKNEYFDTHYQVMPIQINDQQHRTSEWSNESSIKHQLVVEITHPNYPTTPIHGNFYYSNTVNLEKRTIEGLDNDRRKDEYYSKDIHKDGKAMNMSDIKYQTLRKVLDWVKQTDDPDFAQYKGLSIHNFEPRSLNGLDVGNNETKTIILNIVQQHEEHKTTTNAGLFKEIDRGAYKKIYIPAEHPDFAQIATKTPVGREKIFFAANYYPHLRIDGVHITYALDNHTDLGIEAMDFPLTKK